MNELIVRNTLKSFIDNIKDDLVLDITFQGEQKVIYQITRSSLTPPQGYVFISISVENARTKIRNGFGKTTSVPPSQAEYDVVIDIADYAVGDYTEDQLYEKMDSDFQIITDRLIAKLREGYWFTSEDGGSRFRLDNDRTINKNNISTSWDEAAQYHAMLYCRITFQLLEECTDDSTLY